MYIILDAAFIGIAVLFIIFGIKKGFARTLIEVIGYILAVMIAFSVAEYAANYVYENKIREPIISSVSGIANDSISNSVDSISESADKIWNSIPSYITAISGVTGLNKDSVSSYLEKYSNNTVNSAESVAKAVSDNVVKPIAVSLIQIIVALVLIIVLLFFVKILARTVGKLFNKSVFRGLNRFLGGLAGAVKGIIIVFICVSLISLMLPLYNNEFLSITPEVINKTYFFKLFYNIANAL